jgi:hypothetical protein
MRSFVCLVVLMLAVLEPGKAVADGPPLTLSLGEVTRRFTASELLAQPDAADIAIPEDVAYQRAAVYRAVPLLSLLKGLQWDRFDTLEARSGDGFVAQIPLSLVRKGATGGAMLGSPWSHRASRGRISLAGPLGRGRSTWSGNTRNGRAWRPSNGPTSWPA